MCLNREASNSLARQGVDRLRLCDARRFCRRLSLRAAALPALLMLVGLLGCSAGKPDRAVVFYCDGAGWYTGSGRVRAGLNEAKYDCKFVRFPWSTLLGPGTDHFIAARSSVTARRLARRIEDYHNKYPAADIHLMGLSAGTAVVLNALEQLPTNVKVKHVVLLASSASSTRDLTPAMRRVTGNLYNTVSRTDAILNALVANADGGSGPPAGRAGFRKPRPGRRDTDAAYRRVINLPWQPAYLAYDWEGGHVSATSPKFIRSVIAPRMLSDESFPLDRPVVAGGY